MNLLKWLVTSFCIFIFSIANSQIDTSSIDLINKYSFEELLNLKVTTAEKREQTVSSTPASVVVLTRKEIERFGYSSYTDILQHINGLYLIDDYYFLGSVNFGVRGFFSTGAFSNIVILVNGVSQLSDEYLDYPDTKICVPVSCIERIEVIKGPMSVVYGNGAFFGAINIITNNDYSLNDNNIVSASFGTENTSQASLKLSGNREKLRYSITAGVNDTKGPKFKFSDISSDTSLLNYALDDPNSSSKGQMDDNRKLFGINLQFDDFYIDFSYNESLIDIIDGMPNYKDGSLLTTQATNSVLGYRKKVNDIMSTKIQFGYYTHNHTLNYNRFFKYYYELDSKKSRAYDLDLNLFCNWNNNLTFSVGLYRRTVLDLLQIADFGYNSPARADGEIGIPLESNPSTNALYTQLSYTFFESLKIQAGLRVEYIEPYDIYYARGLISEDTSIFRDPDDPANRIIKESAYQPSNNGFVITPRIAAIYNISPYHVIKLMYGKATKQPAFLENLRQVILDWPQLKEQDIQTYEINYSAIPAKSIHTEISVFYNKLNNLITTTNEFSQENGWNIFSSNSGKMKTIGVEIGLDYKIRDIFCLSIHGTYQETTNMKEGFENIDVAYSPKILGHGHVAYCFDNGISISGTYRYIDRMYAQWVTATNPESGERIGETIDPYSIVDINTRWDNILETKIFANLKIGNILNTEIRYPTTTSNDWINFGTLGPGRTLLFTVGYKF